MTSHWRLILQTTSWCQEEQDLQRKSAMILLLDLSLIFKPNPANRHYHLQGQVVMTPLFSLSPNLKSSPATSQQKHLPKFRLHLRHWRVMYWMKKTWKELSLVWAQEESRAQYLIRLCFKSSIVFEEWLDPIWYVEFFPIWTHSGWYFRDRNWTYVICR